MIKNKIIVLLLGVIFIAPLARADECNPGKNNRPTPRLPTIAGVVAKPNKLKPKPIDWAARLAIAEKELKTPELSLDDRVSALRKAADAASQLGNHNKFVQHKTESLRLSTQTPSEFELEEISTAFEELERFNEAYLWAHRWFEQAAYVLDDDHLRLAMLSEQVGDLDGAIFHTKCLLPNLPRSAPIEYTRLQADLIRYAAKSGDKALASSYLKTLFQHIDDHMLERPYTTTEILQETIFKLRETNLTEIADTLSEHHILKSATSVIAELSALEKACQEGDATACINAALILKSESGMRDRQTVSLKTACEIGSIEGCHHLAVGYALTGDAEEKEAAQTFFVEGCQKKYERSCYFAGRYFDNRVGNNRNENIPQASTFYEKGCHLKDGQSCFALAVIYHGGLLGEQNFKLAQKFYERACDEGVQQGCLSLSFIDAR